jgi:hypothetical protein
VQSKVLAAACTQDFREAKNGELDLSEEDPSCVAAFVEYHTKLDYDNPRYNPRSVDEVNTLHFHIQMYIFGDKYDIQ